VDKATASIDIVTMDRRTFVLLTGAASADLLRPPSTALHRPRPPGRGAAGRLRFELDERHRWSLWFSAGAGPVPLVRDAELGAWIGDRFVTLADLEDSTVGSRRPPGGEAVVVRGRAAGVVLEAEFVSLGDADAPQATVTLTLYPDRVLPSVKGVRFFHAAEPELMPGGGGLLALVNGAHSWAATRVEAVAPRPAGSESDSYGAIGLTRGPRGLALAFDLPEPGFGTVKLSRSGLEAMSEWLPVRPLRPEGDASRLRLCYHPSGDGLEALDLLFAPISPVDRERLAAATAPTGWCSWYELHGGVTEADVVANLEFCATHFDRRFFGYVQVDDGYQLAAGDWQVNDKFPHGHRWLTDQIHAKGFKAGLWVAPFAQAERSGVPAKHPEWLLKNADGPIVWQTRDDWGGKIYSIDGAHPEVQQWLFDLGRRIVRDWGYDYLKIDFLLWAIAGVSHYGGLTHAEAYRKGLAAIRDGLGPEAFVVGCGAPLQHALGFVNGMRIGGDVDSSWGGIQGPAQAAALRSFYHRGAWLNDPDCLVVRPPLTEHEAQVWASIVAVSGGATLFSDNLPKLPPERVAILQRTIPVAPVAGRPVGAIVPEPDARPALIRGVDEFAIPAPWRFRTGDDARYGARDYDEEAWEAIPVPDRWERAGHPGYDGFAWYRVRFALPPLPTGRTVGPSDSQPVYLELGKIDDVDETFLNGLKVGQTGGFPPSYRSEWQAFRRYRVPADALNWGGENVLAVRVYDGGRDGGVWSVRRDRPPGSWVVEGAPRWWTVVLVNWDDEARDVAVPLAGLGIGGAKLAAYDVWQNAPLPDLTDRLTARLEPHSSLVAALRAGASRPQVIGTTRHVVQGALDIGEESWDQASRTLRARSTNLDTRPYAVTIAVPRGTRPSACKADPPCTVRRLQSGHVVLEWRENPAGRDIRWEIGFRPTQ
jgi:melibiase-like protein